MCSETIQWWPVAATLRCITGKANRRVAGNSWCTVSQSAPLLKPYLARLLLCLLESGHCFPPVKPVMIWLVHDTLLAFSFPLLFTWAFVNAFIPNYRFWCLLYCHLYWSIILSDTENCLRVAPWMCGTVENWSHFGVTSLADIAALVISFVPALIIFI